MFILLFVVGILVWLFIYWKKMKEDYLPSQIFTAFFYMFFFSVVLYVASNIFFKNYWFWSVYLASIVGLLISTLRYKFKFFENYNSFFNGFLLCFAVLCLRDSVVNSSLYSFLEFVFVIILIGVGHFVDLKYRIFNWYKSGRVGLSGLLISILFFLARAITSIFLPNLYSFTSGIEIYASFLATLIFVILTYNLTYK